MNTWSFYFLTRSLVQRRGRFLLASASVMLTVTSVTALFTVSTGIRERIGRQLDQYGANMLVTDAGGGVISDERVRMIRTLSPAVRSARAEVYGTVQIGTAVVEVIGRDLEQGKGYRVEGRLPEGTSEAMAGLRLRERMGWKRGDSVALAGQRDPLTLTASFERGTDEDTALLMPLAAARTLLGLDGASAVLLNVDVDSLDAFGRAVTEADPQLRTRKVLQVAVAEERLLRRVRLLLVLVTSAVAVLSFIALGSAMGANVIERREEIGLFAAMGASPVQIRRFFLLEAAAAGIAGSVAGYGAGSIAAESIAVTAFGGMVPLSLPVLPLALVLGTCVAAVSSYLPVRKAMQVVPALVLRGE